MSEREPAGEPEATPDHRPALLRRSREDRVIAGVAAGLGRYLGIDPVIIRIAFLVLAFFGGSGILLYLIGWVAMPEEKPGDPVARSVGTGSGDTARVAVGALLVVVGSIWLLERLVPGLGRFVGPAVLILLGLVVLVGGRR